MSEYDDYDSVRELQDEKEYWDRIKRENAAGIVGMYAIKREGKGYYGNGEFHNVVETDKIEWFTNFLNAEQTMHKKGLYVSGTSVVTSHSILLELLTNHDKLLITLEDLQEKLKNIEQTEVMMEDRIQTLVSNGGVDPTRIAPAVPPGDMEP